MIIERPRYAFAGGGLAVIVALILAQAINWPVAIVGYILFALAAEMINRQASKR